MADLALLNNSVAWVHYRLRGGLRSTILFAAAFFFGVGGLIVFSLRVEPKSTQSILNGWMIILLCLQGGILLLYGGGAVRNSVRRDFTSGMMASHRLMPVSGTEAVAGYILGSVVQPLGCACATLLLGILVAGPAHLDAKGWLAGNALLLGFAVSVWVAVACISLLSPKSAGAMLGGLLLLAIPGSTIMLAVPALTAVCSPLVGPTVYNLVMSGSSWSPVLHTSTLAQAAATILVFIAATRKFRRDDVLAAGPVLGMAMVVLYVAISITAILNWPSLQPMVFGVTGVLRGLQLISSTILGLLLSFVPVSAAAWLTEDYLRRQRLADVALGRRPPSMEAVAVLAVALVTLIAAACDEASLVRWPVIGATFACLLSALLPVGWVMRWRYHSRPGAAAAVCLWMVLTWVGPWLVSASMMFVNGVETSARMTAAWERSASVTEFSPIGTLIALWSTSGSACTPGLITQVVLAMAVGLLFHLRRRKTDEIIVPVVASA